jgi:putative FmdB family regulatory protein
MPTYEYICKSCGHLFEIVQSMRDDPLTECPQCGGELRKVFTAPAIAFKGSGFYATDARKKSSRAGETQDKKGSSTSSDKDSKDSSSNDSGSKDSGSKEGGSKDGGSKDGGSSEGSGEKKTAEKKPTATKEGSS